MTRPEEFEEAPSLSAHDLDVNFPDPRLNAAKSGHRKSDRTRWLSFSYSA